MMSEYLSRDIGLGIQGVAIKSGAAKKKEEEREFLMDIMKRSMPPGVKTTVKHRLEMPSGFKIGDRNQAHATDFDPSMLGDNQHSGMVNQLSKEEIFRRMGIDGSKELEIDWDEIDPLGNARTRVELADKMFDVLQKEKSKLEHKKKIFEGKRNNFEAGKKAEQEMKRQAAIAAAKSKAKFGPGSARASPANRSRGSNNKRQSHSKTNGSVDGNFFESMPHGEQPWTHLSQARSDYATKYGTYGGRLPYQDEVDMMHEDTDRYQEINHWYSSMEKPTEDNLEVLRKLNQERLNKLGQMYAEQRARENIGNYWEQEVPEETDLKKIIFQRSNREINQEKQDYKDKFKKYLYNKERMRDPHRSISPQESRADFDRYQCTSPNPKYVDKHNIVPYREDIRIDPSGMTRKELERLKMENDPTYVPEKEKQRASLKKSDEEEDHESMLHWIWNKINPHYKFSISKIELYNFLMSDNDVRDVFNFRENELVHTIESIVTDRPEQLNFEEFRTFMTGSLKNQYSRARQSDLNRIGDRSGVDGEEIPEKKECLVTEELLTIMKENFDRLDKYEDLVVPRAQIVEAIRKDVRAKKFLNKGVVYLPKVKKEISLRKILNQIEQEEFIKADNLDTGDSNFISSKKYISWKKFMDYFVNYSKNQAISDFEIELKKDTSDDQNLVEVPRSLKEKMRSIFNDMKDEEGYVKAMSFLNNLKQDSLIIQNMDVQVRARAKYGEVPDETLCDILSRIEDCIEDYTDWDEFLQYFTKRGTPIATELAKKVPQLTHVVAPLAQIKPTIKRGGSTLVDEGYGGFGLTQPSVASALHKSPSFGFSSLQNPIVGMVFTDNQSNYKREDNYRSNYRKVENVGYNNQREAEVDERTRLFDHRGTPADGQVDLLAQTRFGTGKLHNPPDSHGYKQSYEQNYNEERDGHLPPGFLQQQGHDQYDELVYPSPDQDYIPRPRSAGPMYQEEDDPYVIDDYVYFGDNEKRHKITVPTPLNFEAREHRRNESTKYRKFKEYIEEKRRDDEDALRFRFRAKSVPKAVKEPLFDKIMSDQERKRAEVRKNSIAITRANEKPFSFYERDKDKPKNIKEDFSFKPQQFKAAEVPWFCSTELYARENEFRENQRMERINRRAQELLATSKLPPRMEKHEQQRKQNVILGETRAKIDWDDECTFQPPAAKKMPDFVKAQRHFQNLLDKTRSHKKPTQPMPFNFEANKKIPRIDYLENDNERIKRDKDIQLMRLKNQNNLAKVLSKPTDFVPNATRAFTAKVEHTKMDRNKQADKDRAKVNASVERKRRYEENAVKLRQTLALDEAEKCRKIEESQVGKSTKQDEFRKTTAGYQKKLKEIKSNLDSRPPVYQNYDTESSKKERIAKMKQLLHMEETSKKNKVNVETHLSPEQINMLKDARLLRKMGKI